jgi:hypothetical protein
VDFLANSNSAGTLVSVAVLVLAAGVLYRREDLEVALKWRHLVARARDFRRPADLATTPPVHLFYAMYQCSVQLEG